MCNVPLLDNCGLDLPLVIKSQIEFHADRKIGERLRDARLKLRLNQTELAEVGGVSLGTQHRYEAGALPALEYLLRIGEAGADWYWILTGTRIDRDPLDDETASVVSMFKGLPAFLRGIALAQLRALSLGWTAQAGEVELSAREDDPKPAVHGNKRDYRTG